MITIRLQRVGRKNDPSYRVVVVESKMKPKSGNFLENVGSYDARQDRIDLKADRIKFWIQNGATTSDTVHNLLISQNIIQGKKINVLPKKTVAKKEEPVVEAAPALVAEAAAEEVAAETPAEEAPVENEVATEETPA